MTLDTQLTHSYVTLVLSDEDDLGSSTDDSFASTTARHQWNTSSNSSSQHALSQHTGSRFHDLIEILNDLRLAGDSEPQFSAVASRLVRNNPSIYRDAGVAKFKEYTEAAVEAEVITVCRVDGGHGWLRLCPAYCDPSVHRPASTSTASTPPTHAAGTASPFTPLIDFFKSKQSTSARPISYSMIHAHLTSTLNRSDMISLYARIPGVTTFAQYLEVAVISGLVSLVHQATTTRDAMFSLRDTKPSPSVGLQLPVPVNPTSIYRGPFGPLVASLTQLWYKGAQEPMLSEVQPLVLARDTMAYERVGTMTIKDYVIKAAVANLVIYSPLNIPGASFMDNTVELRKPPSRLPGGPSLPARLSTPTPPPQENTVPLPSVNVTPNSFPCLVAVLTELQASTGRSEFRFSEVASPLLKRRPNAYASVGVARFKAYATLAMEDGVVRIRGTKQGDDMVSLSDPRPGGLELTSEDEMFDTFSLEEFGYTQSFRSRR